jgi:DNA helicase IV
MPETAVDILAWERIHLSESRAALQRMRQRTASLEAFGGDHVSTEHLKQALYRRMKALEDDPTVPLFFGRLDYDANLGAEQDETLYIGRRHVTGEAGGEPLVIDWRAGMSRPFYQARPGTPMGVRLRRRFGFSHGQLTAYEDEELITAEETAHSDIMESEIERPRTGPMRDIVATIQPEQDSIVRAALSQSLCIQGAPGTGKTAIGLHRAAYLLYAFRDQLTRSGVLVVGPNDSFLSYIADVLPALGEIDAAQTTVTALVCQANGVTVRGFDSVPAALVKGDARMAEVLHRAVWSHLGTATAPLVVPRGYTSGGSVRTWPPRSSRNYVSAVCATRLDERCCCNGWLTECCCGWKPAVIPLTIGSRTRLPEASRSGRTRMRSGPPWTQSS